MKRLWGFTWVGWLNLLVLQWLGVRLCAAVYVNERKEPVGISRLSILYPVLPLTGWWGVFVPFPRAVCVWQDTSGG